MTTNETPTPERRVRVTIRCLIEDLGAELPPLEEEIASDHPLIEETKRIARTAPEGLKRVLSIESPLVYRIRHSVWRGAIWVDDSQGLVWLLAAKQREEGSPDDAYEHFEGLSRAARLLPGDDDYRRDRLESSSRFLAAAQREVPDLLDAARSSGGEVDVALGGSVPVRVISTVAENLEETWVAVSLRDTEDTFINTRIRDVIFAIFEESLHGGEWELIADWPGGPLEWFEVARYGVRATN